MIFIGSYYSSVRATPFTFRATQKTEREKHSFFSFSQNDNTDVLWVGAAVLFSMQILFTPHTKPRCCYFFKKKKSSDTASETDPQTGKVWLYSTLSRVNPAVTRLRLGGRSLTPSPSFNQPCISIVCYFLQGVEKEREKGVFWIFCNTYILFAEGVKIRVVMKPCVSCHG